MGLHGDFAAIGKSAKKVQKGPACSIGRSPAALRGYCRGKRLLKQLARTIRGFSRSATGNRLPKSLIFGKTLIRRTG
jgi:hypothetical protein